MEVEEDDGGEFGWGRGGAGDQRAGEGDCQQAVEEQALMQRCAWHGRMFQWWAGGVRENRGVGDQIRAKRADSE
jgi:hypothetical protein